MSCRYKIFFRTIFRFFASFHLYFYTFSGLSYDCVHFFSSDHRRKEKNDYNVVIHYVTVNYVSFHETVRTDKGARKVCVSFNIENTQMNITDGCFSIVAYSCYGDVQKVYCLEIACSYQSVRHYHVVFERSAYRYK